MNSKNKKNWLFFGGMALLIVLSVGATYYRYVVARDYFVTFEAPCDPEVESCFLYECDPEAVDAECSGDPAEDTYYYKNMQKKAYALRNCVGDPGGCVEATCAEGEEDCMEIQCGSLNANSDGECYGPGLIGEDATMDDDTATDDSEEVTDQDTAVGDGVVDEEDEGMVEDGNMDEDTDKREDVIDGSGDGSASIQDNQQSTGNDGNTL